MASMPRLIVGLGNPGSQYEKTRHNAGFWFVDELSRHYRAGFRVESVFQGELAKFEREGNIFLLLKPATYMNHSGRSVGSVARYYKIDPAGILVAHDELEFAPGLVRLKQGGGHGGHNGLKDIIAHLGSADFARLRLGIGRPAEKHQVSHYVLDNPGRLEGEQITAAINQVMGYMDEVMAGNLEKVMNRLNAR